MNFQIRRKVLKNLTRACKFKNWKDSWMSINRLHKTVLKTSKTSTKLSVDLWRKEILVLYKNMSNQLKQNNF